MYLETMTEYQKIVYFLTQSQCIEKGRQGETVVEFNITHNFSSSD